MRRNQESFLAKPIEFFCVEKSFVFAKLVVIFVPDKLHLGITAQANLLALRSICTLSLQTKMFKL